MRTVIKQRAELPAPAKRLYEMFLSAELHGAFTGSPVRISSEAGAEFFAFEGALTGKILETVDDSLIVMSWRSVSFKEDDADSTLVLQFSDTEQGGIVDLIHLDVPQHDYEGVTKGWDQYYWTPWRKYLEA